MAGLPMAAQRAKLVAQKQEFLARLERISANLQRGYDADSKEMAKELEDAEVVDALGNEAREEIAKITEVLALMDNGRYGICVECAEPIEPDRIAAYPNANRCIDCARYDERHRARN